MPFFFCVLNHSNMIYWQIPVSCTPVNRSGKNYLALFKLDVDWG